MARAHGASLVRSSGEYVRWRLWRGPDAAPFRWTRLPALATRIPGRDPRWSRGTARDFTRIRQRAESPQLGNTLW
ncbi:MAG: hypothetical protein N2438_07850 [Limisphaera sp.]|nr:hypothetical protein [Limisphaera sp.]